MKQSITYYLILFVLKLKGVKKDFSKDPIDFEKIRGEDVHIPKRSTFRNFNVQSFDILNTTVTEIKNNKTTNNLVIFIHGGAFISGPAKHHWDTVRKIINQTNHTVWMCDYPKAPESKISEISQNIDAVYSKALGTYTSKQITLLGDSVGGTLITALIQRLISKNLELPRLLILISPVMDATMSNPKIEELDKIDPMLSKLGVLSAKKMCANNEDLENNMISPLYGSFKNFPPTTLYLAENDITYPDQLLAVEKLSKNDCNISIIKGEGMPHIWPLLPLMQEASIALHKIVSQLNEQN